MSTKSRWVHGALEFYDSSTFETLHRNQPVYLYDDFLGANGTDISGATTGFTAALGGTNDTFTIDNEAGVCGVGTLLSGTADNDNASVHTEVNFKGSMSPVMEARLTVDSAAAVYVGVGFCDAAGHGNTGAVSLSGTTWTTTSTDCALFAYDTDATTDVFNCMAVNTDVDATAVATSLLPVAGTYAIYRVDLQDDGSTTAAYFYINGVYQGMIADALSRTAVITPVVQVGTRTGAAVKKVLIDYIKVWSNR